MSLEITLPFGKKDNVKNLVFSILTNEYPLKIIELTNFIRKRYGKTVTFQAVRKAVLQLVDEDILTKEHDKFSINKSWVFETKKTLDALHEKLNSKAKRTNEIESIQGDISVFTFDSLNNMMKFWQELVDDWYKNFTDDYPYNCYQGGHLWEGLLHLDMERKIMEQMKNKGIKSYQLIYNNTPLDIFIKNFYESIGIKTRNIPSQAEFDNSYFVATYGDLIVQAHYPKNLVKKIDAFFRKTKNFETMNIKELHDIVSSKAQLLLTFVKGVEQLPNFFFTDRAESFAVLTTTNL